MGKKASSRCSWPLSTVLKGCWSQRSKYQCQCQPPTERKHIVPRAPTAATNPSCLSLSSHPRRVKYTMANLNLRPVTKPSSSSSTPSRPIPTASLLQPWAFDYTPSPSGQDANLLIMFHGLGTPPSPLSRLSTLSSLSQGQAIQDPRSPPSAARSTCPTPPSSPSKRRIRPSDPPTIIPY